MPDKKAHSLPIDRDTFPGVALAIYPASISMINRVLEQVEAGADLSAVSVGDEKFIAMRRQDWQTLYTDGGERLTLNRCLRTHTGPCRT